MWTIREQDSIKVANCSVEIKKEYKEIKTIEAWGFWGRPE